MLSPKGMCSTFCHHEVPPCKLVGGIIFLWFSTSGPILFPFTCAGWPDSIIYCQQQWSWPDCWGAPHERSKREPSGEGEHSHVVHVPPVLWHRVGLFFTATILTVENAGPRILLFSLSKACKGSTRFRNPRALGCSVPSAARALLRAQWFLNRVDPIGLSV